MRGGKPVTEIQCRQKGGPRTHFMTRHGLNTSSTPAEWFRAFLPHTPDRKKNYSDFNTSTWTSYLNFKAQMVNAGQVGQVYPDFKPFTVRETEQFIGVYILHGLSPTPRVEMKFKSQAQDATNGNDLVFRIMGPNAERRHKHFKSFFSVQDPRYFSPSKKTHPNWKVDPFLAWIMFVSKEAWVPGKHLAADEQTIGFQGKHADKLRVTFKEEGDGFMCDALCDNGYTFAFYFRNQPAPPKYLSMGLSPLHARVLSLFDMLDDKCHHVSMDNLYNSAKFCKDCFNHPMKVLVAGVTRGGLRGVPECIKMVEMDTPAERALVRGTVKAAVLRGDRDCPDLLAVAVYDQKPVYFLSMCAVEARWIVKERKVFDKQSLQMVPLQFLRLNVNDEYNVGMGDVDVADQLRNQYRCDHWIRKRKWWCALFWWGFQVLLVNSYVSYKTYMEEMGYTSKQILSHYEFLRQIALAWLDSDTYWPDRYYKKRKNEDIDSTSSSKRLRKSTSKITLSTNSIHVTDNSLDPRGKLRIRLDHTNHGHWPTKVPNTVKNPNCQLHRWATRKQKRAQVQYCPDCEVTLCIECYKLFHLEHDIVGLKDTICQS